MAQKFKYLNLDYLENYGKNYFKMDVSAELMTIKNKENSNCSLGCFDRMPQSMQGNLNENGNNSMSSSLRRRSPRYPQRRRRSAGASRSRPPPSSRPSSLQEMAITLSITLRPRSSTRASTCPCFSSAPGAPMPGCGPQARRSSVCPPWPSTSCSPSPRGGDHLL